MGEGTKPNQMRKLILLLLLLSVSLKAQIGNHHILLNNVDSVGVVSFQKGVLFYADIDNEIKKDIALRFNKTGSYFSRKKTKLDKLPYSNDYYSYDTDNRNLVKIVFNDSSLKQDERKLTQVGVNQIEQRIEKIESSIRSAGDRYMFSELVAIGGTAVSLSLAETDPATALQIFIISQSVAYIIRITGHIRLKSTSKD